MRALYRQTSWASILAISIIISISNMPTLTHADSGQMTTMKNPAELKTDPNYQAQLRKKLTSLQYAVTQENSTERPFANEYWDNKQPGIYVDIVSGEVLFSSLDKFDSGTGWPSFTRPLAKENIQTRLDHHLFMTRNEVRSVKGNSHLGHVFEDGPAPTGLRYCINSAALRFIPAADLEKEGYGDYATLFKKSASSHE